MIQRAKFNSYSTFIKFLKLLRRQEKKGLVKIEEVFLDDTKTKTYPPEKHKRFYGVREFSRQTKTIENAVSPSYIDYAILKKETK